MVRVVQGATLERSGQALSLRAGQSIESGDVISTDRRGQVQLLFNDETRIAVGPNSTMAVDDIRFKPNGKARKFAVSAVAGGFRFLSGTSARSAYAIDTPTATMGIRGTAFDFVVRNTEGTDLVIFSGLVNMCGRGGCYQVTGGCDAVRLDARGNFARIEQKKDKRELINDGFFFVTQPQKLRQDFRTNVRSCGRDVISKPVSKAGDRAPPPPPPKAPPVEPPEEPGPQ
ncbi:MAG: FecR family protein [Albidovulum sp.]